MSDLNVAGGVWAILVICGPLLVYAVRLKHRRDKLNAIIKAADRTPSGEA